MEVENVPSSTELLSLSSCRRSSLLERLDIISSSESMVVEAVVSGVGGEPGGGWAAEAEILLFGWMSSVGARVASAAFLLRVWGEMVTETRATESDWLWGLVGACRGTIRRGPLER